MEEILHWKGKVIMLTILSLQMLKVIKSTTFTVSSNNKAVLMQWLIYIYISMLTCLQKLIFHRKCGISRLYLATLFINTLCSTACMDYQLEEQLNLLLSWQLPKYLCYRSYRISYLYCYCYLFSCLLWFTQKRNPKSSAFRAFWVENLILKFLVLYLPHYNLENMETTYAMLMY